MVKSRIVADLQGKTHRQRQALESYTAAYVTPEALVNGLGLDAFQWNRRLLAEHTFHRRVIRKTLLAPRM